MSGLGQRATWRPVSVMSALALRADVVLDRTGVGFGSGADIAGRSRHVRFTLENGHRLRAYRSGFEQMVVIRPVGIRTRSGFRISTEGSPATASSVSAHLASQTTTRPSWPRENRANWRDLGRLASSPVVVRRKKGPIAGPFWLHMRQLPPRADWLAEKQGFEPAVSV
jgi:hypothetical protein